MGAKLADRPGGIFGAKTGTAAALAVLAALGGCEACLIFDENVESFVDAPTTTQELEAWAEARGLTADVALAERNASGNIACGHSAACVILLPVILVNEVMPPTTKRGSVLDEEGAVLYAGLFDLRGRLVRAQVRVQGETDVYRTITRLSLPELGEHPIVETQRQRIGEDGRAVDVVATPLLPQVDLVARYDEALREESDAGDRGDLVVEELGALGEPGLEAVEARYEGLAQIDDEELRQALRITCRDVGPGAQMLVRFAREKGGLLSAIAATDCLKAERVTAEGFEPIVRRLVDASCVRSTEHRAMPAAKSLGYELPELVSEAAASCDDAIRRAHLLYYTGQRPDDAMLLRILREDRMAGLFVHALPAREAKNRPVLLQALDSPRVLLPIARDLSRGTTVTPTADEARLAIRAYASAGDSLDAWNARHYLLEWVNRGEAPAAALGPLRQDAQLGHNAAALVLLADDHLRLGAAVARLDPERVYWTQFRSVHDTYNEHTLIGFALTEAGCTREEITAAARARRGETPAPCAAWSR